MEAQDVIEFQPASLIDFVIHFKAPTYHVHSFVLHQESTYFRVHLDDAAHARSSEVKRAAVVAADTCRHPPSTPCLTFSSTAALQDITEDDFTLFLRHVSRKIELQYPPLVVGPAVMHCPTNPYQSRYTACISTQALVHYTGDLIGPTGPTPSSPLLHLFQYFECQDALKRCDEVLAHVMPCSLDAAFLWLPKAVELDFTSVQAKCVEALVQTRVWNRSELSSARVMALRPFVSCDLLSELFSRISTHNTKMDHRYARAMSHIDDLQQKLDEAGIAYDVL